MLARPTPAQAFPTRQQRQTVYVAQHPGWYAWATTSTALWQALPTLDPLGLVVAQQLSRAAAWVLDGLLATAPAHVGLWLVLAPAVTAAWQTWTQIALTRAPATPTQTLALTPGAQGALQQLTAWDPVRQSKVPADPEAALVAACQGVSVVPTQLTTAPTPNGVILHPLTAFDTLLSLATQYLGDPEAWPTIQQLNQLRAPYISDRLWDQYGPPLASWILGAAGTAPTVAAGATTVTVPGVPASLCPPGSIVVLEQWTASGRQQEAHAVASYDAATASATLTTAVAASYTAGAAQSLNLNPAFQTTQVLAPGDVIQIPANGQAAATTQLTTPSDPLGTDLLVTATGDLQYTATGDLATASGIANLLGALSRRLDSALGTLPLHPTYGSGLSTVLGDPLLGPAVVTGYVTLTLLQDPRVQQVSHVQVTASGDAWVVSATVQPVALPQPVTVTATVQSS